MCKLRPLLTFMAMAWSLCHGSYLLMNKKRYAGLLWTNTDKHDKMDCKVAAFLTPTLAQPWPGTQP